MRRFVSKAVGETHVRDLVGDGLLRSRRLDHVDETVIAGLEREAKAQREVHHANVNRGEFATAHDAAEMPPGGWCKQAETPLFRSKRCERLAALFRIHVALEKHLKARSASKCVESLLASPSGCEALGRVIRLAKGETVGTLIADLTVCGAVPPYSDLLGGKLVAMLAASPEVVSAYRTRYEKLPSLIASSMAGRPIIRPAGLCFIGTTTLYGERPNQYDRAAYPCDTFGGNAAASIRYRFLDRSVGFGTSQFSWATKDALDRFMKQSVGRGSRANNVFGEGANPRMRGLRESLTLLGMEQDQLLRHGQPKCVYGVWLAENVREVLLGIAANPRYFFPRKRASRATDAIAQYWLERWVRGRLNRPDILERLRQHTLVRPIRHGARVSLPEADVGQRLMFEGVDEWSRTCPTGICS